MYLFAGRSKQDVSWDKFPLGHTSAFTLRKSFLPRKVRTKKTFSFFPVSIHHPLPPPPAPVCMTAPPLPPPSISLPPPLWVNPVSAHSFDASNEGKPAKPLVVTKLQQTTLLTAIDITHIKKEPIDNAIRMPTMTGPPPVQEDVKICTVEIPSQFPAPPASSFQEKRGTVALAREAKLSRKRNVASSHLPLSTLLIEGPYQFSLKLTQSSYQYGTRQYCHKTTSEIILPSPARMQEAQKSRNLKHKATLSLIDLSQLSYGRSRRRQYQHLFNPKRAKRTAGQFYPKDQLLFSSQSSHRVSSHYDSAFSSSDGEAPYQYYDESMSYNASELMFKGYFNSLYEVQPLDCKRSAKRRARYKRERMQKDNPFPDLVIAGSQFESFQQQLAFYMTNLIDTTLNQVGEMIKDKERKYLIIISST